MTRPAAASPTPIRALSALFLAILFALTPGPVVSLVAMLVGRFAGVPLRQAQDLVSAEPLVFAAISVVSVIPPLWLVRQPLPRPPLMGALGVTPVAGGVIAVAGLTGLAMQLPLCETANLVELIAPVAMEQKQAMSALLSTDTPLRLLKVLIAVVVAAPLCEELLFRGALLRGMTRVHGAGVAVLVSSLLFGVAHAALITSVLPAALAGLAFSLVTLRTGSIVPSMVMHAAVNAVPVLVPRSRLEIVGFNTLQEGVYHVPPLWLVPSCVLTLAGLWWLNRSRPDERRAVPVDNQL